MRVEESIEINRPLEEVFNYVSVILRSEVPSTTTMEQGQQDQQTTTHEG